MASNVPVNLGASGTLIAAIPGFTIVVISVVAVARVATDVKFQSAGTDLTGPIPLAGNAGFVMPTSSVQYPWLRCNLGEALNLNMSTSTQVSGTITYEVI
jgi:hypothetical protein